VSEPTAQIITWHPLANGCAPTWASGWGEDRDHGPLLEITLAGVTQRLRWVPPGWFRMGSPADKSGRFAEWESPQHVVTIARGFWLFDTPCTQAMWAAVMDGDAPSRFKSPERPVETVSWNDVQRFLHRASGLVPGLRLSLPTEAQWEHACRAFESGATYAGPIEILGDNNAPILDDIAWYGGNCGVEFDMDEGHDTSDWEQKQHEFSKGGTAIVATKTPNPWGLYDMPGNVWEWCADGRREYEDRDAVDPVGPQEASADRVIRGGAWNGFARDVRAASRDARSPDSRGDGLGFRCRVQ